jgi:hypothetical protein
MTKPRIPELERKLQQTSDVLVHALKRITVLEERSAKLSVAERLDTIEQALKQYLQQPRTVIVTTNIPRPDRSSPEKTALGSPRKPEDKPS